jgi:hypothetical protein
METHSAMNDDGMAYISIISDGTPHGTKVTVQDTGKAIAYVQSIDWHLDVNGVATVTLVIKKVPIELKVEEKQVHRHIVL